MILERYDTQEALDAALAAYPAHASSSAMQVTAFAQVAEYGEADPETGEAELLSPAIVSDGYWLLVAGPEPLVLPEGVVAVDRVFA